MREAIKLPPFGEGVASAEITAWLVDVGDTVERGEDLLEVQTTKASLTVAAPNDGVLAEQLAEVGEELEVGAILGWLTVEGDDNTDDASTVPADLPHGAAVDGSDASQGAVVQVSEPAGGNQTGEADGIDMAYDDADLAPGGFLSPRVRRRMQELGLTPADCAVIAGSGAGGRLTAADLERYAAAISNRPQVDAAPVRLAIADAMRRSWTRPLATVARLIDVDPVLSHRRKVAGRPNLTVYAVRALARALTEDDRLAWRLVGRKLVAPPEAMGIGVAVAVDDVLLTPVVKQAADGDLSDLSGRIDDVIAAARHGRAAGDAVQGVATVSNYGSLGLIWATPIPPAEESLLLGVGSVQQVPRWNPQDKTWTRGAEAELTITFDHRVGDGAAAARLLHAIARFLERPEQLV